MGSDPVKKEPLSQNSNLYGFSPEETITFMKYSAYRIQIKTHSLIGFLNHRRLGLPKWLGIMTGQIKKRTESS